MNGERWSHYSTFYPHIFDHARLGLLCRLCPTSADYRNSRWRPSRPELVAAILNSGKWAALVSLGRVTDVSGMVANVGVAVRIGSQTQSVQLLFPFPVSVAAILIFGCRLMMAMSGNVSRCRQYHIRVGHDLKYERVEVGITAPSVTGQKLFPLPA